jgi:hypothetical protein
MDESRKKELRSAYDKFKEKPVNERKELRKRFDAQQAQKKVSKPNDEAGQSKTDNRNDRGNRNDGGGRNEGSSQGGGQGGGRKQ